MTEKTGESPVDELDLIEDGKLPDEPSEEAGETPAETEEPEAEEASQDAEDAGAEEPEDGEEKSKPKKGGFQKRIDELTRDKREWERRAAALEAELRGYRQQPASDLTAPDPKSYELGTEDPNFIADLTLYKADRRREQERAEDAKRAEQQRAEQAKLAWQQRVAEAARDYDDYREVALANFPVTDAMAEAIQASDVGPHVLYWLGQNQDEAAHICTLTPTQQAIAIGRIESRLEDAAPEAAPKKTTAAPPPAKRLTGKVSPRKDPSNMSMEEYRKYRYPDAKQ